MIEINKWEEKQLRKTIPNLCVARTGKSLSVVKYMLSLHARCYLH